MMDFKLHIRRVLLTSTVLSIASAVGAGLALGADSTLSQQCSDASRGDGASSDDPEICGHGRMLRQGGNVYVIYEKYAQIKLQLVTDGFAKDKSAAFARFRKDNTCLQSDLDDNGQDIGKAVEACQKRVTRWSADAVLQARKELLRQGGGREELVTDKGAKNIKDVLGSKPGANAPTGDKPDTVVKDIADAVAKPTGSKNDQAMALL
ncbi:MAG: hypothetical protein HY075_06705, partial [Deltaproteobacteria bacterium]|nr:hypothetical protein [Deltaproteobacteria bacterium]